MVQVVFFTAVLSAEVALAAWLRGVARVLATGTSPALRGFDRELVRRCGTVTLCALTMAAGGWAALLVVLTRTVRDGLDAGVILALALLTASVGLGWLGWSRLRFNVHDEPEWPNSVVELTGWHRAEGILLTSISRWPIAVCAVMAIGSAMWVLFTAETATVVAAWPWATAQAAAVVLGFFGLGARLGLRNGGDLGVVA